MFRLISIVLILAGLVFAAYGALQLATPKYEQPRAPATVSPTPSSPTFSESKGAASGEVEDIFSIASATDDFLSGLRSVPIAHELPGKARFGLPFDVTVAIDGTGDSSAADALPGTGNITEGTAQVSATVMAALSGDAFDIVAVTPMTQTVSPLTENVWRWRVTPTSAGAQTLRIQLFALDGSNAMPVRTFQDTVEVEVSRVGQVVSIVDSFSPLAVVLGGIGSLLAGLIGLMSLIRRR